MKQNTRAAALIAAVIALFAGSANAGLESVLGGQAVNDTDRNITWLTNANLAASNTFGLATGVNLGHDSYGFASTIYDNGSMTFGGAQKWIAAMNDANYLGYNDWRLPTTTPVAGGSNFNIEISSNGNTDYGHNNTATEMGHLFYTELGNKGLYNTAGQQQDGYGLANTGPFTNFQSYFYWSGTEFAPKPYLAWYFYTPQGLQGNITRYHELYALVVRDGQIASVPELGTFAMLIAGLGLMGFVARRKQA